MNPDLFRAVLDRIIPRDDYPSASDSGVDRFILTLWEAGSEGSADLVAAGLAELDAASRAAHGLGFEALAAPLQDERIEAASGTDWFKRLCEMAAEGYYADPSNGANPDAVAWRMIGYRPGLPDGPDGPPWNERDAVRGRLWS